MSPLWLKLLTLFAALLNAAPTGLCCSQTVWKPVVSTEKTLAAQAPALPNCCAGRRMSEETRASSHSSGCPRHPRNGEAPSLRCCCQLDAVRTDSSVSGPLDDGLIGQLPAVIEVPQGVEQARFAAPLHDPGPPRNLQILLCVRRC